MICRVCDATPTVAKSLCATCYQRQRRRGLGTKERQTLDDSRCLQVVVSGELADRVEKAAHKSGQTVSEIIREILSQSFRLVPRP
jgi:hypothetical protein